LISIEGQYGPRGGSRVVDEAAAVVVVSADTHIGPRLVEDLRQYCPAHYLAEFDRFATETAAQLEATLATFNGGGFVHHPNLRTLGHYDCVGSAG
jgi:hypothetical protein